MTTAAAATEGQIRHCSLLLVDDHDMVREGLGRILAREPGMTVVGTASSGEEALGLAPALRPAVVLMDARMPGMGGVAAAQRLIADDPDARVVMFTAHAEHDLLWEALDAGVRGFVLKDSRSDTLVAAIHAAMAGERFVDPRLAAALPSARPTPAPEEDRT